MTATTTNSVTGSEKKTKQQAKDVLPNTNCTQAAERAKNAVFVFGDLDLQTYRSEGPNTSSMRISCKFVPQFLEIFHTNTKKQQKTQTDSAKNGTFHSSLRALITTNSRFHSQFPRESGLASYPT